jgi:hypothetical protein
MALKTLGQQRPSAASTVLLYQVPAGKQAVVANIIVCNPDAVNEDDFTIYQVPAAGSPGTDNVIFNDTVPPKDSYVAVNGISLAEGESIRVVATNGRLTFTCSGDES